MTNNLPEIYDFAACAVVCIVFIFLSWYWIRCLEHSECDECGHEFGPYDNVNIKGKMAFCDRCWDAKNRKRGK